MSKYIPIAIIFFGIAGFFAVSFFTYNGQVVEKEYRVLGYEEGYDGAQYAKCYCEETGEILIELEEGEHVEPGDLIIIKEKYDINNINGTFSKEIINY